MRLIDRLKGGLKKRERIEKEAPARTDARTDSKTHTHWKRLVGTATVQYFTVNRILQSHELPEAMRAHEK